MTEIARREELPGSLEALARFAEVARATHVVAQSLAGTSFVPSSMKNKPEEVTGAMLAGSELNLPPMAALASIDIIEGRPAIRANTMRGLLLAAGGEIELVEANDSRVIMRARLTPVRAWQEVTWTLDRARKMGLDGKSNWKKMPQAMMIARATSELVRLVAAHLLIGMPYSSEELGDEPSPEAAPVKAKATTRTAQRQPFDEPEVGGWKQLGYTDAGKAFVDVNLPEPVPEPVPEPAPPVQDPAVPDVDGKITDTTRKAIMAAYNDLGVKGREERLTNVSEIVGRDVPSVNVLTEPEGRRVVRSLQVVRTEQSNATPPPGSDYDWPAPKQVGA